MTIATSDDRASSTAAAISSSVPSRIPVPWANATRDSPNRSRSAPRIVGHAATSSAGWITSLDGKPNGFAWWRSSASVSMWGMCA